MKLTVFGNNATCPEADGACSCYLLQTKGKRILLDMGNGSAAKLQKHLPLTQLDAIIISHLHFDHFGDLFCAKYALETKRAYGENLKPIPLPPPSFTTCNMVTAGMMGAGWRGHWSNRLGNGQCASPKCAWQRSSLIRMRSCSNKCCPGCALNMLLMWS